MSLIARSKLAQKVARHLLRHGPQVAMRGGCSAAAYRRALRRLEKSGVLRRWEWNVDGREFRPRCQTAGYLWLPGPRWHDFEDEAAKLGIEFNRLREAGS